MSADAREPHAIPHYLRFARAMALAGALGGAAGSAGCCPVLPDTLVCAHCTCSWQSPSASAPLSCSTLHREPACCPPALPVVGPLSPPELSS